MTQKSYVLDNQLDGHMLQRDLDLIGRNLENEF